MKTAANNLRRIQIVLVDTQDAANIGAACRAMKTMGISRLAIVSDKEYDDNRIKTLALHAFDIYEHHRRFTSLEEALSDSVLSAGATRRRGKFRKYASLLPEELADTINQVEGDGLVSIVFGRESSGLSDEELFCCDMAAHIPSSPEFPSLNLSQAVQVFTYTLYRELRPPEGFSPIDRQRMDQVTETITESFDRIDFFKQNEREEVRHFFRDILSRASLTETEASRLEKMFRKMASLKIHRPNN